jgi:hypothetical protein
MANGAFNRLAVRTKQGLASALDFRFCNKNIGPPISLYRPQAAGQVPASRTEICRSCIGTVRGLVAQWLGSGSMDRKIAEDRQIGVGSGDRTHDI